GGGASGGGGGAGPRSGWKRYALCVAGSTQIVFAPANVGTVATTVYLSAESWCTTVTLPSPPFGMKISFFAASHPSASTRVPFVIDATTLPVSGLTTTDVLLQPEKMRFDALSYAMPVGPSHGPSGHDAIAFHVLTSITWIVFLLSLFTKMRPLPSAAAPSGAVSSSSTVATTSPDTGSIAVSVPIGRLWFVRMILSSGSSYMMPSSPRPTLVRLPSSSVCRSNISTV